MAFSVCTHMLGFWKINHKIYFCLHQVLKFNVKVEVYLKTTDSGWYPELVFLSVVFSNSIISTNS